MSEGARLKASGALGTGSVPAGPVAVFAGTTEGRLLCERLSHAGVPVRAFAATEYGGSLVELPGVEVHAGRLDEAGMAAALVGAAAVVDATHPFAVEATRTIRAAVRDAGLPYLRLLRPADPLPDECVSVASAAEAARFLAEREGNALLTTGSKELAAFCAVPGFADRFYARVLPEPSVLQHCLDLGFPVSHLIAMQGPFSVELNVALLHAARARWLVTKDAGAPGGLAEKLEAARLAGATPLVIARPVREEGLTLAEVCAALGLAAEQQRA